MCLREKLLFIKNNNNPVLKGKEAHRSRISEIRPMENRWGASLPPPRKNPKEGTGGWDSLLSIRWIYEGREKEGSRVLSQMLSAQPALPRARATPIQGIAISVSWQLWQTGTETQHLSKHFQQQVTREPTLYIFVQNKQINRFTHLPQTARFVWPGTLSSLTSNKSGWQNREKAFLLLIFDTSAVSQYLCALFFHPHKGLHCPPSVSEDSSGGYRSAYKVEIHTLYRQTWFQGHRKPDGRGSIPFSSVFSSLCVQKLPHGEQSA